jgi:hypothetical protein
MSHFAKVLSNIVVEVIVADQHYIDTGLVGDPSSWVQTSYNTRGGVHLLGGTPIRKNFAGVGFTYDVEKDAFIPPKPYASWVLINETCLYQPPVEYHADGKMYRWDEETINWKLFNE